MDIANVSKTALLGVTSGSNFFTMAKAQWLFFDKASSSCNLYVTHVAEGQSIVVDVKSGTSVPLKTHAPTYYPYATKGAECGAIVSDLAWADANLEAGYEWAQLSATDYFVSGVLNSSKTQFNNPFDASGDYKNGACWQSGYASGVNPFV